MRDAEQVTFGGSGFNRAGHVRGDVDSLAEYRNSPSATAAAFWRGKPLVEHDNTLQIVWLPLDHPLFQSAIDPAIFLGLQGDKPKFAFDISRWTPRDDPAPASMGFLDTTEVTHPLLPVRQKFVGLRNVMALLSPRDAEIAAMAAGNFAWHRAHGFCARCGNKTAISQGGWQRRCAGCGSTHFPRTDPVVIMLVTHGNDLLLGRSPNWPKGMFSLLAGFMEPGETIEAAVRREVHEETKVEIGRVDYLNSQPWPFPASLMIGCRAEALSREITIDPVEIEQAKWMSRAQILEQWTQNDDSLVAARKGAIAHFLIRKWLSDSLR